MEKIDQLIHARWIIPGTTPHVSLEGHALAIRDKKILAILPSKEAREKYQANEEINYGAHAVTPGLINCHTHAAMNIFRGLADDLALMDWLNHYIWPAEKKWLSHDFVYDGTLLAIAEMIRGGTTCFNDMYFFLEAAAQAAEISGIRAHIGMTIIDFPTPWAQNTDEYFAKAEHFYAQYKNHERIVPTMAPHSTYTVSLKNLERIKTFADANNVKINIHLQEAPSEIEQIYAKYHQRPLQLLNSLGMVNPNLIAVHMTQIDDNDFALLEKNLPNLVHCPESNMKLASGACPVEKLHQSNINVALGTDGAASNNDLDMFGEMRSAAFLGKITANDPRAVSAETTFSMATLHGAKALGIDHIVGTLEAGKSADFIAINIENVECLPIYHPISQIVYATPRTKVTDVWVAGKQLMKDRELITIDEKEVLEKAKAWGKKIKL